MEDKMIQDWKNRISYLRQEAIELVHQADVDCSDYEAFFLYHDETKADFLCDAYQNEILLAFIDQIPDLHVEKNIRLNVSEKIASIFLSSDLLLLKAITATKKMIAVYNSILSHIEKVAA